MQGGTCHLHLRGYMDSKLLSLKLDVIFKIFFTRNQDLLKSFVAAILDIPVKNIRELIVTNPELPPEKATLKEIRLDLCLKLNNQVIDIEIQVRKYHDFKDRVLFYWAKLFTSMLKSGEEYSMLKPAVAISIVDFSLFQDIPKYQIDVVPVIKGTRKIFSDKMRIRFFELPKLARTSGKIPKQDLKYLWLSLFNAKTVKDLDMLRKTNHPEIIQACDKLQEISEDQKLQNIQWAREKALHDYASAIGDAKRDGFKKGEKKGVNQIVAKMRKRGFTDQEINDILNTPDD